MKTNLKTNVEYLTSEATKGLPFSDFPDHLPARSAMGVNGLARGARVEIEVIAVVK